MTGLGLRLTTLLVAAGLAAAPEPGSAEAPGGSNYGWYKVEACQRDEFILFREIDAAPDLVADQLRQMYAAGQRRLRLPLFFFEGSSKGSFSVGRDGLAAADQARIGRVLALVRASGFEEIILAFFPIAVNGPGNPGWSEAHYEQNWLVIRQVRRLLVESGLPYLVDLHNEAMPHPSQPEVLAYTQRLWRDYATAFGTADTLGFSVIPDPARIAMIPRVYGDVRPGRIDLHFYEPAKEVLAAKAALQAVGLGDVPWIVGESYYDDAEGLATIRRLAAETGTKLLFILQWPLSRARTCPDVDVVPLAAPPSLARPPP